MPSHSDIIIKYYKDQPIRFLNGLPSADDVETIIYREQIITECEPNTLIIYPLFDLLVLAIHRYRNGDYFESQTLIDIVETFGMIDAENDPSNYEIYYAAKIMHTIPVPVTLNRDGTIAYDISYTMEDMN